MSNKIRKQPLVAVSGNRVGNVPVVNDILASHEQEKNPITSLNENCKIRISNGPELIH